MASSCHLTRSESCTDYPLNGLSARWLLLALGFSPNMSCTIARCTQRNCVYFTLVCF
jgi:hypothetical protein